MTDCYDVLDNNCDYILNKVINKREEATCSELEDLYLDLHDCGAEYSCAEFVELNCLAEELYDDDSLVCPRLDCEAIFSPFHDDDPDPIQVSILAFTCLNFVLISVYLGHKFLQHKCRTGGNTDNNTNTNPN